MKILCKFSILIVAIIHLIQPFFPSDLSLFLFFDTLILLVSVIPFQTASFKKITLSFLFLGTLLLTYGNQPLSIWVKTATSMTNVIAILVVMQLFTLPIATGKYSDVIGFWLNRSFTKESSLFLFTTLVTHLFSSFLLFGTVPIMISLFGQGLQKSVSHFERFTSAAVARGYALVVLWSPGAVNVFLVLQATGVQWIDLLVPGLLLSLIGIVLSYFLERTMVLSKKPLTIIQTSSDLSLSQAKRKSIHIFAVVFGLISATILFEKLHIGSNASRIILAGLLVSVIWLSNYINNPKLPGVLKDYWETGVLKSLDLAGLFVAMGLFAGAVDHMGILTLIQPYLQYWANEIGIFSIMLVPLFMITLAMIGIHPFILIIMLGKLLTALHLPISNVSLALALSLGGAISYILSPFGGIVLTLAKFINAKSIDIAFKWNITFSTIYLAIGILFSYLWGLMVS